MNPIFETALAHNRFWRNIGNYVLVGFLVIEILLELWPESRSNISPWQRRAKGLFAKPTGMRLRLKRVWYSFDNELTKCGAWLARRICNKRIVSLIAAFGVASGVGLEIIYGNWTDEVVDKMRAPRSLSKVEQNEIQTQLKPFGPHKVVFLEINDVDPEIAGITRDLSKACGIPGWYSGFESQPPNPPEWLRGPMTGILVLVSPSAPDKTVLPTAKALVSLLQADELEVELSQTFAKPFPLVDNRIRIIVYSK